MQIGVIGLGKMGSGLVSRLIANNHEVVTYDSDPSAISKLNQQNIIPSKNLNDFIKKLKNISITDNIIIWVMIPSGKPTEDTLNILRDITSEGDIIIDGGNSYYKDTLRRSEMFKSYNVKFLDAGTSGGAGADNPKPE